MAKLMNSLVSRVKAGLKKRKEPPVPKREVVLTSYSQPHVLQYRMKENEMTHDQKVLADISPIRLERSFDKMILYFCPADTLKITDQINPGDGGMIPHEAVLNNMEIPETMSPGLYTLKNVLVHSNGTMSVTATPATAWEKI